MSERQVNRPLRTNFAFSLVETLVCVAILAVLVGILASVFNRGKKSAHEGVLLSNGHQIGLAMNLYAEDNSQLVALSVLPALRGEYVTPEVVSHAGDPFENGAACAVRKLSLSDPRLIRVDPCDTERVSWFGLDDFGTYTKHYDKLRAHPDGGPVALVIERGKQVVKKPYYHA